MPKTTNPIRFKDVSFSFGKKRVLENLNFDIEKGKIYSIIGESGSGKTTSLKLINGLLKPSSGQILIDKHPFDYRNAELWRRRMGYSIQGSGLFPHMSLIENMGLIARKTGWSKNKVATRAKELCELIHLPSDHDFLKKKPREVSGGQQQRVGIARAIFMTPQILLMDEPFGALDPITREEIHNEFLNLQEKLKMTIVLVTHDLSEAFKMSDELILLREGRLAQKGRPSQLLLKPKSDYIKKFLETNSPNHQLKSIKLYSVAHTDIYVSRKQENLFVVSHKETGESKTFSHLDHVFDFHTKHQQQLIYWVTQDNTLENTYALEPRGLKIENMLYSRDHILSGIKQIFQTDLPAIPVIDANNKFIGVFSREAIDSI